MVNTCSSVGCVKMYLVTVFLQLDERRHGWPIRVMIAVRSLRPKLKRRHFQSIVRCLPNCFNCQSDAHFKR